MWFSFAFRIRALLAELLRGPPTSTCVCVQGRCKATWKWEFKLPWREAGPPNHHDDKVKNILCAAWGFQACTPSFLSRSSSSWFDLVSGYGVRGVGFGVLGLGFRIWCLVFRVWGLGIGDWGLGFGVWGLGFGVWGLGFRVQGSGYGVQGTGFGVWCLVFGAWCLVFGVWCLVFGVWCLVFGV